MDLHGLILHGLFTFVILCDTVPFCFSKCVKHVQQGLLLGKSIVSCHLITLGGGGGSDTFVNIHGMGEGTHFGQGSYIQRRPCSLSMAMTEFVPEPKLLLPTNLHISHGCPCDFQGTILLR